MFFIVVFLAADVDECADDPVPCTNGMCTNTIGSFFCTCNDGYIENGARTACIGMLKGIL